MEDCCSDMRGCLEDCSGSGCGLCMCWRNSMIDITWFSRVLLISHDQEPPPLVSAGLCQPIVLTHHNHVHMVSSPWDCEWSVQ